VQYHATCIRVGEPFHSRFPGDKCLVIPGSVPMPHYVCELCQVRAVRDEEIGWDKLMVVLLMLERMRQVDVLNAWSANTMKKYGPYLRWMHQFGHQFGVNPLQVAPLERPPNSAAIPLAWAELMYSLRTTVGRDGERRRILYNTVRGLRSAAAWYHSMHLSYAYPGRVMRDRFRRGMILEFVSPTEEAITTLSHSGMARRLGTFAKKSWALSPNHIHVIDQGLRKRYSVAERSGDRAVMHELASAGSINLLAYLGWERSSDIFMTPPEAINITPPSAGPTRDLPPGVGAVEHTLLAETKSDPTLVADVVIAYTTLSGLSVGFWLERLLQFAPYYPEKLFSTATTPEWASLHFRENFAIPILEEHRRLGDPTLSMFSNVPGQRMIDKIYSIHSWRRAGRSKVSRVPRHGEPRPRGARKASPEEVYEHGRWEKKQDNESMPRRYNQWDLSDRIPVTYFCM
jgi:hypothetical protein